MLNGCTEVDSFPSRRRRRIWHKIEPNGGTRPNFQHPTAPYCQTQAHMRATRSLARTHVNMNMEMNVDADARDKRFYSEFCRLNKIWKRMIYGRTQ